MFNEKEIKAINKALKIIESKRLESNFLNSTQTAQHEAILHLGTQEREVFTMFFLNTQYRIIAREDLFFGTIDAAQVYIREVVKASLINNATAVVLAHNHPSGRLDPSDSDLSITSKIQEALKLVDIKVLDHIIVAHGKSFSFAEKGLI